MFGGWRDHGAVQRATGGLAEEAPEDVEGQSADVGEEFPVQTAVQWPALGEEHAQYLGAPATLRVAAALGYGPDELPVGHGEQQVFAEVLAHQESALLGAGGA